MLDRFLHFIGWRNYPPVIWVMDGRNPALDRRALLKPVVNYGALAQAIILIIVFLVVVVFVLSKVFYRPPAADEIIMLTAEATSEATAESTVAAEATNEAVAATLTTTATLESSITPTETATNTPTATFTPDFSSIYATSTAMKQQTQRLYPTATIAYVPAVEPTRVRPTANPVLHAGNNNNYVPAQPQAVAPSVIIVSTQSAVQDAAPLPPPVATATPVVIVVTATPTATFTPTETSTPTATETPTATPTETSTPTETPTNPPEITPEATSET